LSLRAHIGASILYSSSFLGGRWHELTVSTQAPEMKTELMLVFMAGVVLSAFLIIIEIAAMRKLASRLKTRLIRLYQSRRILRLLAEISAIAAFFIVQPFIVAFLVTMALDQLNFNFSKHVIQEIGQLFSN